jgi:uncharacterized protein (TIGR02231 family)
VSDLSLPAGLSIPPGPSSLLSREGPPAQPSKAVRVTLFEDRAEVVRAARIPVEAGMSWIALGGVSPYIDERTIQARAPAEGFRVHAARVRWIVHYERAVGREALEALEREMKEAGARDDAAAQALDRAQRRETQATQLMSQWLSGVAIVPRRAADAETRARWSASYAAVDEACRRALDAQGSAREQRARAAEEYRLARKRLDAATREHPRFEAVIEVQIEAPRAAEADIGSGRCYADVEVVYRVPCAVWRPEHLARIAGSPQAGQVTLEIVTWATAWQCTGEVWEDVEARFSTARPARAASPPTIEDDVISSRKKTDLERSRVTLEAREQTIAVAGVEGAARAVDEMPGVDDGGEPVVLAPRERITLASTGEPFRVEVARVTLPATLQRVLFPERAPVAHLRAAATLTQGGPLLAGPVRVARGMSLVGRSKLDYVGKGEPFEIGFGADDGVRVRRTRDEERDTVTLIGTQKLRRTVKIYLVNLSAEPKHVLVTERVPVSEIQDVEVSLIEAGGWRFTRGDGFAEMAVDLAPRATRTLTLVYEIKAGSRVVMPF